MGKKRKREVTNGVEPVTNPAPKKKRRTEGVDQAGGNEFAKMRLMSWNTQGTSAGKSDYLVERMLETSPDLVLLQELGLNSETDFLPDVLGKLTAGGQDYGSNFAHSKRSGFNMSPLVDEDAPSDSREKSSKVNPTGNDDGYGILYRRDRLEMQQGMRPLRYETDDNTRRSMTRRQPGTRTRPDVFSVAESGVEQLRNRPPMQAQFKDRTNDLGFNVLNWHAPEGGGGSSSDPVHAYSGKDSVPAVKMLGRSSAFSGMKENPTVGGMDANVGHGFMKDHLGLQYGENLDSNHLDHLFTTTGKADEGWAYDDGVSDHPLLETTLTLGKDDESDSSG